MRRIIICLMAVVFHWMNADAITRTDRFQHPAGDSPTWGPDVLVSSSEPTGRPSAVARPNGTVYAAVPDTLGSGHGVKIYRSTNFGNSWSMVSTGPASAKSF